MTSDQITGVLRALLAALGGFFVAKGTVSADTFNWLAGGILSIVPIGWSLWTNRPAGLAGSAQATGVVNVQPKANASDAVVAAVQANK